MLETWLWKQHTLAVCEDQGWVPCTLMQSQAHGTACLCPSSWEAEAEHPGASWPRLGKLASYRLTERYLALVTRWILREKPVSTSGPHTHEHTHRNTYVHNKHTHEQKELEGSGVGCLCATYRALSCEPRTRVMTPTQVGGYLPEAGLC